MYREILVPTDGSEAIATVLDHTTEIASGRGARIHVLYVIDDGAFLTLDEDKKSEVMAELGREGERAVGDAASRLEAADLETTTQIRKGTPAEEIVAYVEEEGIDLVTMGTRGDDYTNNILGSTAQTVVTEASAPVLTVNVGEE